MKEYLKAVFNSIIAPIMVSLKNYSKNTYEKGKKVTFYKLDTSNIQVIEEVYEELVKASTDYPDVTVTLKRGEDDFGRAKASTYKSKGDTYVNKSTVIEVWESTKEDFNPDSL